MDGKLKRTYWRSIYKTYPISLAVNFTCAYGQQSVLKQLPIGTISMEGSKISTLKSKYAITTIKENSDNSQDPKLLKAIQNIMTTQWGTLRVWTSTNEV